MRWQYEDSSPALSHDPPSRSMTRDQAMCQHDAGADADACPLDIPARKRRAAGPGTEPEEEEEGGAVGGSGASAEGGCDGGGATATAAPSAAAASDGKWASAAAVCKRRRHGATAESPPRPLHLSGGSSDMLVDAETAVGLAAPSPHPQRQGSHAEEEPCVDADLAVTLTLTAATASKPADADLGGEGKVQLPPLPGPPRDQLASLEPSPARPFRRLSSLQETAAAQPPRGAAAEVTPSPSADAGGAAASGATATVVTFATVAPGAHSSCASSGAPPLAYTDLAALPETLAAAAGVTANLAGSAGGIPGSEARGLPLGASASAPAADAAGGAASAGAGALTPMEAELPGSNPHTGLSPAAVAAATSAAASWYARAQPPVKGESAGTGGCAKSLWQRDLVKAHPFSEPWVGPRVNGGAASALRAAPGMGPEAWVSVRHAPSPSSPPVAPLGAERLAPVPENCALGCGGEGSGSMQATGSTAGLAKILEDVGQLRQQLQPLQSPVAQRQQAQPQGEAVLTAGDAGGSPAVGLVCVPSLPMTDAAGSSPSPAPPATLPPAPTLAPRVSSSTAAPTEPAGTPALGGELLPAHSRAQPPPAAAATDAPEAAAGGMDAEASWGCQPSWGQLASLQFPSLPERAASGDGAGGAPGTPWTPFAVPAAAAAARLADELRPAIAGATMAAAAAALPPRLGSWRSGPALNGRPVSPATPAHMCCSLPAGVGQSGPGAAGRALFSAGQAWATDVPAPMAPPPFPLRRAVTSAPLASGGGGGSPAMWLRRSHPHLVRVPMPMPMPISMSMSASPEELDGLCALARRGGRAGSVPMAASASAAVPMSLSLSLADSGEAAAGEEDVAGRDAPVSMQLGDSVGRQLSLPNMALPPHMELLSSSAPTQASVPAAGPPPITTGFAPSKGLARSATAAVGAAIGGGGAGPTAKCTGGFAQPPLPLHGGGVGESVRAVFTGAQVAEVARAADPNLADAAPVVQRQLSPCGSGPRGWSPDASAAGLATASLPHSDLGPSVAGPPPNGGGGVASPFLRGPPPPPPYPLPFARVRRAFIRSPGWPHGPYAYARAYPHPLPYPPPPPPPGDHAAATTSPPLYMPYSRRRPYMSVPLPPPQPPFLQLGQPLDLPPSHQQLPQHPMDPASPDGAVAQRQPPPLAASRTPNAATVLTPPPAMRQPQYGSRSAAFRLLSEDPWSQPGYEDVRPQPPQPSLLPPAAVAAETNNCAVAAWGGSTSAAAGKAQAWDSAAGAAFGGPRPWGGVRRAPAALHAFLPDLLEQRPSVGQRGLAELRPAALPLSERGLGCGAGAAGATLVGGEGGGAGEGGRCIIEELWAMCAAEADIEHGHMDG